jgi:hypothetical protein
VDAIEAVEVQIASIHDVIGAGLADDVVADRDIVFQGSGAADKSGNVAAQVEQRMHLDGRIGGTEMRPGEQAQTQLDGGRVQRVGVGVEVHAEAFLGVELAP